MVGKTIKKPSNAVQMSHYFDRCAVITAIWNGLRRRDQLRDVSSNKFNKNELFFYCLLLKNVDIECVLLSRVSLLRSFLIVLLHALGIAIAFNSISIAYVCLMFINFIFIFLSVYCCVINFKVLNWRSRRRWRSDKPAADIY